MAVGFSESYIRLWSLNGEKLSGYRSGFQSSSVKDGTLTYFNYCDDSERKASRDLAKAA